MLLINGSEITGVDVIYGIRRPGTDDVLICETEEEARFDAILYGGEVVMNRLYETGWAIAPER